MPIFWIRMLTVCAFLVGSMNVTQGDDWPQYRGKAGDGKSAEAIAAQPWPPSGPKELWRVPTPLGFSSFSIAGERAVTLVSRENRETCVALDADTGSELWAVKLGSTDYGHDGGNAGASDNRGGDGPRSTPAIDGERVYVFDSHLELTCLDATTGKSLWSHDLIEEFAGRNVKWFNATAPVLDDGRIFVAGGGPGESFLAFDQVSGELIWKSGDELITHATPTVATINGRRQVIFFCQSGLVSVDAATGSELWRCYFKFSVSSAASPVVSANYVYCSAGYGVGAALFKCTGDSEPTEVWYQPNDLMNHWSTPVVHKGHLYGLFEFKKYGRAPLQCVDLMTGEVKWKEAGFGPGNCILVGDKLVVLSDSGELVIASANPVGYDELARTKAVDGKCWSTPAFSDGRVYVRSTTEGVCFEVPADSSASQP